MKRVKDYSFGIVLFGLFLFSIIFHYLFQVVIDQKSHVEFVSTVMENWQSEFLQLLIQVAGLKWLLFKGSPQSKDSDQEINKKLDTIITLSKKK